MEKIIIVINRSNNYVVHAIKDILPKNIEKECNVLNNIIKKDMLAKIIDRKDPRLKKVQKTILIYEDVELFE